MASNVSPNGVGFQAEIAECPICYEDMTKMAMFITFDPCKHNFCPACKEKLNNQCAIDWKKIRCPLCRTEVLKQVSTYPARYSESRILKFNGRFRTGDGEAIPWD